MKVDKADKGMLAFAPVAGVAALALLAIPLLPALFAANPDQVNWARLTTACRSPRLSPVLLSPRLRPPAACSFAYQMVSWQNRFALSGQA